MALTIVRLGLLCKKNKDGQEVVGEGKEEEQNQETWQIKYRVLMTYPRGRAGPTRWNLREETKVRPIDLRVTTIQTDDTKHIKAIGQLIA